MQKFCYPRKRSFTTSTQQGAHEAGKSLTAKGETPGLPLPSAPVGRPPSPRLAQGRARRREAQRSSSQSGERKAGGVCVTARGREHSTGFRCPGEHRSKRCGAVRPGPGERREREIKR